MGNLFNSLYETYKIPSNDGVEPFDWKLDKMTPFQRQDIKISREGRKICRDRHQQDTKLLRLELPEIKKLLRRHVTNQMKGVEKAL